MTGTGLWLVLLIRLGKDEMDLIKAGQLTAIGFAICLAMGCSSGGGHHSNNSSSDPAPTGTDTSGGNTGVPASGATAGTASGQTYVTPTGATYTLPGTSGTAMTAGQDGNIMYSGNGYSRFGTWYSSSHSTTEYFYTGDNATQAAQVPTQGTATYAGKAIRTVTSNGSLRSSGSTDVGFNVDFGAKTISGTTTARQGFDTVSMNGSISGGGFSGNATSGSASGDFKGHFYGAGAEELAGMATFASDSSQNIAFGATKQ